MNALILLASWYTQGATVSKCHMHAVAKANNLAIPCMQCHGISIIVSFWGAEGAPILFSEIGFCMASCSYIYIYIIIYNMYVCMYVYLYI